MNLLVGVVVLLTCAALVAALVLFFRSLFHPCSANQAAESDMFSPQKDSAQEQSHENTSHFRKWIECREVEQSKHVPERTAGGTESPANIPKVPQLQATPATPGQPQPKDFRVTSEQVAAHRPADPEGYRSFGFFLFTLLLCGPILLLIDIALGGSCYIASFLAAGAFIVWCALRLSRSDPSSREIRGRIEAYLHAKAEYEKAVRQAELERRRRQEDYWCKLSGRDFEKELARLYKLAGYAVETTPVTGDEGADLVLRKDGQLIVVQCKRHDKPVGPATVRELHGTLLHFGGNRATLAATGGFTEGARRHAQGKPIELLDLNGILRLQEGLKNPTVGP